MKLLQCIGECSCIRGTEVAILGDFNLPKINWLTMEAANGSYEEYIYIYIYIRSHQEGSILDLIISKDKEHITNIEYGAHLGKSDHLALKVTVNELIYPDELEPRSKFQYHKGDYQGIRNQLGRVSWSSLFEGKGVNECWSIFKAKILELQDEFIPTTPVGTRHKPHWMDRTVVLALKEKKNAWRKYVFCRSSENFEQYKSVRNRTKSIILDAQRNFERKIAREAKVNPKSFWNYVGKKVHPKSRLQQVRNK